MGSDSSRVDGLVAQLARTFKIRDMGPPSFFLGIETMSLSDGILLSQRRYIQDILRRAGMVDCKSVSTPISVARSDVDDSTPFADPTHTSPTTADWAVMKRVLRYVKGTLGMGLCIRKSESLALHAFSDSDWAGNPDDRKSTSGFAVFLGSNLIAWSCRKQRTVARSSTEAEYKALADVATEVTWLVSLLREIGFPPDSAPGLWCDNLGATYLCANPVFHARTKHVEIDYHFVRDKVAKKELQVHFISTKDQLADIFTKPLASARFSLLRDKLNISNAPP
ncbi:PREDICTED: uncharacterized protein LOC109150378 [Ipomoea nil]|uniref:uncharacterized protein LOC109150378 n=1 Tax=Ipomoea nil TaxID=35883 RepID=UPI0009018BB1|nr:PREDICTED: uncharacterized protein LOC109150378 [Ipomoea nil]